MKKTILFIATVFISAAIAGCSSTRGVEAENRYAMMVSAEILGRNYSIGSGDTPLIITGNYVRSPHTRDYVAYPMTDYEVERDDKGTFKITFKVPLEFGGYCSYTINVFKNGDAFVYYKTSYGQTFSYDSKLEVKPGNYTWVEEK